MRSITVEPAVLLFMFTVYLWYPLCTEMIYESIPGSNTECSSNPSCGPTDPDCTSGNCTSGTGNCTSGTTNTTLAAVREGSGSQTGSQSGGSEAGSESDTCQERKKAAQEEVSRLQSYISASRHIPAFFSSLLLGPFTDRYGRRPVMIISCIGNTLWTTILLTRAYLNFSVYYFMIGSVLDGMCGGVSTFLFASFAYIADTSSPEDRTKKIALTEGMVFLGGFIASVTGGIWAQDKGFGPPLFAVLLANVAIICYVAFKLPEPRKVSSLRSYHLVDHLRRTTNVLCSPAQDKHFLWLCLVTFSLLMMAFAGTNNIFILFLCDEPFNWKKTGIGYFLAFNTLLNGIITLFALPQFNKVVGDHWTAVVGVFASIIGFIVVGVSSLDWMLFLGATIGAIGSMSLPTLRSQMSKMISPNSQGSLFSLISAAEILCVLVSTTLINLVYEVTHDYFHGFVFLIEAGLAFLALGLLVAHRIIVQRRQEKEDKETLITNEQADPDQLGDCNSPPFYTLSTEQDISVTTVTMSRDLPSSGNIRMKPQLTLTPVCSRSPSPRRYVTEGEINFAEETVRFSDADDRYHGDVISSSDGYHGEGISSSDDVTVVTSSSCDDVLLNCDEGTGPPAVGQGYHGDAVQQSLTSVSLNCGHVTCSSLCNTSTTSTAV